MDRYAIFFALLLAGCSSQPSADLQYIKQARSVAAEWAMVNEQAGQNKLSGRYVKSMHGWLRQQLQAVSTSLSEPESDYGAQIRSLLRQPDNAAPDALRARADTLKKIEDRLESA